MKHAPTSAHLAPPSILDRRLAEARDQAARVAQPPDDKAMTRLPDVFLGLAQRAMGIEPGATARAEMQTNTHHHVVVEQSVETPTAPSTEVSIDEALQRR